MRTILRGVMKNSKARTALLSGIGARVRALRQQRNLGVREFATRAELSPRFINQLESGEGNISIARLDDVAEALGCALPELLPPRERDHSLRAQAWRMLNDCSDADWQALLTWLEKRKKQPPARRFIALIGLRGAGKSTVGPLLAKRLKTEFVELDRWVEEAAGMPLAEIFHIHGEAYFSRLENEALNKLLTTSPGCVFATGGSIVSETECWAQIKQKCYTVWLHATPQEFLRRMKKAGETRLTTRPTVLNDLKALLARREPLYAESQLTVKTSGKKPSEIVSLISKAVATFKKA